MNLNKGSAPNGSKRKHNANGKCAMWNRDHKQERLHDSRWGQSLIMVTRVSPWASVESKKKKEERMPGNAMWRTLLGGRGLCRHSAAWVYAWPFGRPAFVCIVIFTNQLEKSKWNVPIAPYWVHSYWFPCWKKPVSQKNIIMRELTLLSLCHDYFLFQWALKSFQMRLLVCDTRQNRFQPHICGITWVSKILFTSDSDSEIPSHCWDMSEQEAAEPWWSYAWVHVSMIINTYLWELGNRPVGPEINHWLGSCWPQRKAERPEPEAQLVCCEVRSMTVSLVEGRGSIRWAGKRTGREDTSDSDSEEVNNKKSTTFCFEVVWSVCDAAWSASGLPWGRDC